MVLLAPGLFAVRDCSGLAAAVCQQYLKGSSICGVWRCPGLVDHAQLL